MTALRILVALLLTLTAVTFVPSANAAACTADPNPTDDDGVSATCTLPNTGGQQCTVTAGQSGSPGARLTCNPPIIVCIREPCP